MRRALLIISLLALAACGGEPRENPEEIKLRRDSLAAALAAQLKAINYDTRVALDGNQVSVTIGSAMARDVRKAICRERGWPSANGQMIELNQTLRRLRETGVNKLRVFSDVETLDTEIGQDGRCQKSD